MVIAKRESLEPSESEQLCELERFQPFHGPSSAGKSEVFDGPDLDESCVVTTNPAGLPCGFIGFLLPLIFAGKGLSFAQMLTALPTVTAIQPWFRHPFGFLFLIDRHV